MDRIQFKLGLQKLLKKHKLSYRDIAQCWKLSESSVKRIMTTGDFSLERLLQLADLIGIQMSELMQTIEGPPTFLVMSATQDELLSNQPDLLYLYIRFTAGDDIDHFSKTQQIPIQTCWQMAYALDKVGLIEIHKDNRIKIGSKGPYYFKPDGQILKNHSPHFFKTLFYHFMNENKMRSPLDKTSDYYARPFELYMTDESYKKFIEDAHRLFMKYRDFSKNDNNIEKFNRLRCVSGALLIDQFDAWRAVVASLPKSRLKS
jgi:transcriptional regulator with XRE-family HTH domain